jgi:dCTP deaminase
MLQPVKPFVERTVHPESGMTYGVGPAGYDVRVAEDFYLHPGDFRLASTVEHFEIPPDIMAFVKDKSTLARAGLSVFNTVIEPGWRGHLTLELKNQGPSRIHIMAGMPIAQIVFHLLDVRTDAPYEGKYQDQPPRPVDSIFEL